MSNWGSLFLTKRMSCFFPALTVSGNSTTGIPRIPEFRIPRFPELPRLPRHADVPRISRPANVPRRISRSTRVSGRISRSTRVSRLLPIPTAAAIPKSLPAVQPVRPVAASLQFSVHTAVPDPCFKPLPVRWVILVQFPSCLVLLGMKRRWVAIRQLENNRQFFLTCLTLFTWNEQIQKESRRLPSAKCEDHLFQRISLNKRKDSLNPYIEVNAFFLVHLQQQVSTVSTEDSLSTANSAVELASSPALQVWYPTSRSRPQPPLLSFRDKIFAGKLLCFTRNMRSSGGFYAKFGGTIRTFHWSYFLQS